MHANVFSGSPFGYTKCIDTRRERIFIILALMCAILNFILSPNTDDDRNLYHNNDHRSSRSCMHSVGVLDCYVCSNHCTRQIQKFGASLYGQRDVCMAQERNLGNWIVLSDRLAWNFDVFRIDLFRVWVCAFFGSKMQHKRERTRSVWKKV